MNLAFRFGVFLCLKKRKLPFHFMYYCDCDILYIVFSLLHLRNNDVQMLQMYFFKLKKIHIITFNWYHGTYSKTNLEYNLPTQFLSTETRNLQTQILNVKLVA